MEKEANKIEKQFREKKNFLKDIFFNGVESVKPHKLIQNKILIDSKDRENITLKIFDESYNLSDYSSLSIFGSGKASVLMSEAFLELCDKHEVTVENSTIISNITSSQNNKINILHGDHPVPQENSLKSSQQLFEKLTSLQDNELFIFFLSGGTSSMFEIPLDSLTFDEVQETYSTLLKYAIPIEVINSVRKKLSKIKNGKLNKNINATGIIIVMSDVIDNRFDVIGSAPFFNSEKAENYRAVFDKFDIWNKIPEKVSNILKNSENEENIINKFPHFLLGSNQILLENISKSVKKEFNLDSIILSDNLFGEAKEVAKVLFSIAKTMKNSKALDLPILLIFGGETTVTIRNPDGKGGRNQELALAFLNELKNEENITFLSAGTDGIDGQSDSAGAVVNSETYEKSKNLGYEIDKFLNENNSFTFFSKTDSLITTGKTGINLMDLVLILIDEDE